jgi:ferritin-like metal-binding protein YciE
MPHVTTSEELFTHELKDLYYAEKTLTKTLPQLAKEATDRELRKAFESHLAETEKQVVNLERVFEQIGEPARPQPCPGIEGIKKEHDEFVDGNGAQGALLDTFLTGSAARAEHYEIAAYTGLVAMARALGHRDSIALLQENLKQEKDALKKVETISRRLLRDSDREKGAGSGSARRGGGNGRTQRTTKR